GIPIILALNKIDLLTEEEVEERIRLLEEYSMDIIPISATEGTNLEILVREVETKLPEQSLFLITLQNDSSAMSLVSWLHDIGHVETQEFKGNLVKVLIRLEPLAAERMIRRLPADSWERLIVPEGT
ncbi:MAG: hypothetical protein ACFE7R_04695, partial [Candidatus Hodarchaeota archaeon]